jgi:hypothetical protein
MAGRFDEAIRELVAEIEAKGREIAELKKTVNFLRQRDGLEALFPDTEPTEGGGGVGTIQPGQFYGKSPITAAREYLEMKGKGKVALPDEIVAALLRGSFDFKAQGWESEANRVRNIAISMGKNTAIFHRLPNGYYGLVKWYPELAKKKRPMVGIHPDNMADPEAEEEGAEQDARSDSDDPGNE